MRHRGTRYELGGPRVCDSTRTHLYYIPSCKGFHVLAEIEQIVGGLEETKGDKEGGSVESPPSLDLSGDPELLDLQRPEKRAPGDSMDSEYPYVLVLVSCVS